MTVLAIVNDDTGEVINMVDDANGKSPPLQYCPNQSAYKEYPDGVWVGWLNVNGEWSPPSIDSSASIINQIQELPKEKIAELMMELSNDSVVQEAVSVSKAVIGKI